VLLSPGTLLVTVVVFAVQEAVNSEVVRNRDYVTFFFFVRIKPAFGVDLKLGSDIAETPKNELTSVVKIAENGHEEGEEGESIMLVVRQIL